MTLSNWEVIKQRLVCYLNPFRSHKTDWRWDKKLNHIIDNCKNFKRTSRYGACINGIEIWVSNWPYAYGSPYGTNILPSRTTTLRLRMFIAEIEGGFFDYKKLEDEKKLQEILNK